MENKMDATMEDKLADAMIVSDNRGCKDSITA
jgi:hypothetical protein